MRTARLTEIGTWHAAALYLAAAVAWTWPLLPNIAGAIAWDLGDPMLVAWIMGWVNDSVLALFRGDLARFLALWDPPIFHPEPLALSFSEHFIPQSLLAFPVHALTGNVILSYNVAVLTTFVLSALGMFLLARELTGSTLAGLLAGAMYGFAPYRVDQLSHLQILSSQWMPLALYGLRRYFTTLSPRPLVWSVLALTASNLSSGYYLFYFAPFVAAYALYEMRTRGLIRRARVWAQLAAAAAGVLLLTIPFLLPYLAARAAGTGPRSYEAIRQFSADIYAYATSSAYIRWAANTLDAMRDAPENAAFPGVTVAIFGWTIALVMLIEARRRWAASTAAAGPKPLVWAFLIMAIAGAATSLWIAATGGRIFEVAGVEIRMRNFGRLAAYTALAFAIAAGTSPRLRAAIRGDRHSVAGLGLLLAFSAFLLSLGPRMESRGTFVGLGVYNVLMPLPGFDGLRVPARFAMIVAMWMTVAGAYAAARLRGRPFGTAILALFVPFAVLESCPAPFRLNEPFAERDVAPLTMTPRLRAAAPLYDALRNQPRGVLLELPWGSAGWDIQFMHEQRGHGWPLVNGFSGHFPIGYLRTSIVKDVFVSPDRAWWALERSGASHVIVHEWAFRSIDRGKNVTKWLRDNGAVEVASTENDRLLRLPGGIKHP